MMYFEKTRHIDQCRENEVVQNVPPGFRKIPLLFFSISRYPFQKGILPNDQYIKHGTDAGQIPEVSEEHFLQ